MKKKLLVTLISAIMLSTFLFACGSADQGSDDTTAPDTTAAAENTTAAAADTTAPANDLVTLKMYFHGSNVTDDSAVLEKVNVYLAEKLGVQLSPIWGTWGDFDNNVLLSINGGEDVDIYFTCSWSSDEYNSFAARGAWLRLDDPDDNLIEKYASDFMNSVPSVLVQGATVNGNNGMGIYAVPGYKDIACQYTWDINVPLLEQYGYSIDDIKNTDYYGFGEILQTVKDGEGDSFYPLLVEGGVLERMVNSVSIVTGDDGTNNILSYYLNPSDVSAEGPYGNKIMSKFETEEYKNFAEKTREYFNAGFIDPVMGIADQANDARTSHQNAGTYLIGTQSYAYGYENVVAPVRGFTPAYIPTTDSFVDTTTSQGAMMAISVNSKNPDLAMQFLNLLNTDSYLMTLLNYGIEGVHYDLNADGEAVFTEERKNYQPWTNGVGNVTLLPPVEGQGADFQAKFKEYYAAGKEVPYLGFAFDRSDVDTELATLSNIAAEYALGFSSGTIDPAERLPEFIQKLKDAGIDRVVEEANRQLDEFMAAK